MDHVNEEVRVQVERGVDVVTVSLAGVDAEQFAGVPRRRPLAVEVGVPRAAGTEPVTRLHRLDLLPTEDDRVDIEAVGRVLDRLDPLDAALAELDAVGDPARLHVPERAVHGVDLLLAAGLAEQAVLETVRRRDEVVERESATCLLRDRVADVGVCVDERGEDDVVTACPSFLDGGDLAVLDDHATLHGHELRATENRAFEDHDCPLKSSSVAWTPGRVSLTRLPSMSSPSTRLAACPTRSLTSSGA